MSKLNGFFWGFTVILCLVASIGCAQQDSTPDSSDVEQNQGGDDENAVSDAVDIDSELEEIRDEFDLPALAAIVFEGDEVVAEGAVGVRSIEAEQEVTREDPFHIGSCTKPMTGTLVGRLSEKEYLGMDDTLEELFPELALEDMHEDYRSVTMGDLLRHEAGLPSSLMESWPDLWSYMWERGDDGVAETRLEVASQVLEEAPESDVGTYSYSNAGYIIAGAAMARS